MDSYAEDDFAQGAFRHKLRGRQSALAHNLVSFF